jgi:hypothetical protein
VIWRSGATDAFGHDESALKSKKKLTYINKPYRAQGMLYR